MKAIVHHEYGGPDDLELADVDEPVPSTEEILVRVRAVRRTGSGLLEPQEPRLGRFAGVVGAPKGGRVLGPLSDFSP